MLCGSGGLQVFVILDVAISHVIHCRLRAPSEWMCDLVPFFHQSRQSLPQGFFVREIEDSQSFSLHNPKPLLPLFIHEQ